MASKPIVATCTNCHSEFTDTPKRDFLGFPKLTCPSCNSKITYPLTKYFYVTYWLVFILMLAIIAFSAFYYDDFAYPGGLGIVATYAIFKDWSIKKRIANIFSQKTWFYSDELGKHGGFTEEKMIAMIKAKSLDENCEIWPPHATESIKMPDVDGLIKEIESMSTTQKTSNKKLIAILVGAVLALGAYFLLISRHPRTYEDCVLEGMKSANTDISAHLINKACLQKFPMTSNPSIDWNKGAISSPPNAGN